MANVKFGDRVYYKQRNVIGGSGCAIVYGTVDWIDADHYHAGRLVRVKLDNGSREEIFEMSLFLVPPLVELARALDEPEEVE